MIVRTYGRRSRGIERSYSSDTSSDAVLEQESGSQDLFSQPFSTQESSSHWSPFDFSPNSSQDAAVPRPKKPRLQKAEPLGLLRGTSTLMETQEFGEMMEHVDEVNFALDGLRKPQPLRIRRASLLSLLSICATASQRRLLRAQGLAKTILDAILGLSCDDLPSNLAVAALLYSLTGDGQDDHLLESPTYVCFLIKLINPIMSTSIEDKAPKIGCKLLALRRVSDILHDTSKRLDSCSAAIVPKVEEILVSCKEIKSRSDGHNGKGRPELSPKWIALLTMEKACLSKISLEDTSGTVRKTGGNFKEKLRELGGLDAVFEVARNCHSVMEGWTEKNSSFSGAKNGLELESLVLLLKCLKIMENATFLSKENQDHLLGMKVNLGHRQSTLCFTELIINVIKILSGLYLLKRSAAAAADGDSHNFSNETSSPSELAVIANSKVSSNENICISSSENDSIMDITSEKSANLVPNSPWLSIARRGYSVSSSETATISMNDSGSIKMRANSFTFGSCSQISRSSNSGTTVTSKSNGLKEKLSLGRRTSGTEAAELNFSEDSQDPYAFDEDEFRPSKWDLLSGKPKPSRTRRNGVANREIKDAYKPHVVKSQQELSNGKCYREKICNSEHHHSGDTSCSGATDEEGSSLLADCLLTAVKVLMNLTNENPVGCRQIASSGGLETLSALIAGHFPLFSSSSFLNEIKWNTSILELENQRQTLLNDQELDFLVAILGLLVNMVEKDGCNRSRLASASVLLASSEGETQCDVIPLLCTIFLVNQGAGEAAEESKAGPWDDEVAMLQGEKEAEKMIVEAYAALLLAFLSTERSIRDAIAECLPGHNLAILIPVLDRFVAFHLSLNMISPETHKAVSEVIESCRVP